MEEFQLKFKWKKIIVKISISNKCYVYNLNLSNYKKNQKTKNNQEFSFPCDASRRKQLGPRAISIRQRIWMDDTSKSLTTDT